MKRLLGIVAVLALAGSMLAGGALAQDATPVTNTLSGADLGLADYAIEVGPDSFVVEPEVQAGRVLVTVSNTSSENLTLPFFLEIPAGESVESLQEKFEIIATTLQTGGPPTDGSDPFAFLYDAHIVGGTSAPAGESRQVIVDLSPGNWVIADLDFIKALVPVTVTGEMPTDLPAIEADATLSAIDTGDTFDYALEGDIVSGQQIVAIVNASTQPHFTEFTRFDPAYTVTEELFSQWVMVDLGMATPDPQAPMPPDEALTIVGFASLQSPGTTQWLIGDFAPGTYSTTCWVPDPRHEGAPHSAMGMYTVFAVE